MYSLESPHQGDSNEYTQHTIIVKKMKKKSPEVIAVCFLDGFMINPQWLELPMSRINFHGPKDVRVTELLLYIVNLDLIVWVTV